MGPALPYNVTSQGLALPLVTSPIVSEVKAKWALTKGLPSLAGQRLYHLPASLVETGRQGHPGGASNTPTQGITGARSEKHPPTGPFPLSPPPPTSTVWTGPGQK